MFRITVLILVGISCSLSCICLADYEKEVKDVKLETKTDGILWVGSGFCQPFDSNKMTANEKKIALDKGLAKFENLAEEGQVVAQVMLAGYYFSANELKKGMYFSLQAAEAGSSEGMFLLSRIYFCIFEDTREGIKWALLSAATGNKKAVDLLSLLRNDIKDYDKCELVSDALNRAEQSSKEHPKIFFTCPNFRRFMCFKPQSGGN